MNTETTAEAPAPTLDAPGTAASVPPRPRWLRLVPTPQNASAIYLLVVIVVTFTLWVPDLFLTEATFRIVLSGQAVVGLLALAALIPLTAGAFDLSIGSLLALSVVIVTSMGVHTSVHPGLACVIAVAACAGIGAISGLITVVFRVNSFIATLGMSQVVSALILYISSNEQIVGGVSPAFMSHGLGVWFGVPKVAYYLVAAGLLTWYLLEWTPLGRHMFATGANQEAARLSGIPTSRVIVTSLAASGGLAGVAGLVYVAQTGTFSNSVGPSYLFPAYAAVFFGATQFRQRPNVWGTVIAVYVLALGVKGLQLALASGGYWITPMFNGAALLIAVAAGGWLGVLSGRRTGRRRGFPSWRKVQ